MDIQDAMTKLWANDIVVDKIVSELEECKERINALLKQKIDINAGLEKESLCLKELEKRMSRAHPPVREE